MDELIEFAAKAAAEEIFDHDKDKADKSNLEKRLAEQLRDMIKNGMSDECSICLSEFNHPVITPCAHLYCLPCITQYIETDGADQADCPLCRAVLKVDNLLEAAPDDEEELYGNFEDIEVNGSSTKINAVMKEIEGARRDFPNDKTIIVSQFTSLLSIIQVGTIIHIRGVDFNKRTVTTHGYT